MNPIKILDECLLKEERQVCNKIRPSGFGRCYRQQHWNRSGEPETNPCDAVALRVFLLGNLIHKMIQDCLPPSMVELAFETEDEKGHADFVEGDRVWDFKSVKSNAFQGYSKKQLGIKDKSVDKIAEEKLGNILQVIRYAMAFKKPIGTLVFIDKDALETRTVDFYVAEWKDRVEEELAILRGFWAKGKLPPAMPRTNWDCENKKSGKKYCRFYDRCKEEEGKKG